MITIFSWIVIVWSLVILSILAISLVRNEHYSWRNKNDDSDQSAVIYNGITVACSGNSSHYLCAGCLCQCHEKFSGEL